MAIILIDDMGFGATSAFGGPINMPTLERVAADGLKYNRFHTTALCSPTRQALLTGRNHHSVGMGSITETATTAPGYNSIRPNSAASIQETLRLNGYNTAAFGKMHQTPVWEVSTSGPFDHWPTGEGFEYFYGFVGAETNQWAPTLFEGTVPVEPPDDPEYHLTPDLVDHAITWVQAQQTLTPDKPFFVYLSFGATHAPHHVPDGVQRQVQRQVRHGLGRAARDDAGEPEEAGRRAPGLPVDRPFGGDPGLDGAGRRRQEGSHPADGDLCRLCRAHRLPCRPLRGRAGGDGRAGQHPHLLHRRRQRRQRRGLDNGHIQRDAHAQLCAGHGRKHSGALRRSRHGRGLQPLPGRLGPCHGHPLPVDQTGGLALGRHAQRHGRALAQGHQGQRARCAASSTT